MMLVLSWIPWQLYFSLCSRDSLVSIVTRAWAGWFGFDSWQGQVVLPNQLWGPPSLLSKGYRGFHP
jgi:hypothetical protein